MKKILITLLLGLLGFVGYGQDTIYYNGLNSVSDLTYENGIEHSFRFDTTVVDTSFDGTPYLTLERDFSILYIYFDPIEAYDSIVFSFNVFLDSKGGEFGVDIRVSGDPQAEGPHVQINLKDSLIGGYSSDNLYTLKLNTDKRPYTSLNMWFDKSSGVEFSLDNLLILGYKNGDVLSRVDEVEESHKREVISIYDLRGNKIDKIRSSGVYIYWYSDGSKEKRYID